MKRHCIVILIYLLFAMVSPVNAAQPYVDESSLVFKKIEGEKPQKVKFILDLPAPFMINYPKGFAVKSENLKTIAEYSISCVKDNELIDFTLHSMQGKYNARKMLPSSYTLSTAQIGKDKISIGELFYLAPDSDKWQEKTKVKGLTAPQVNDFCASNGSPMNMSREQAIYWYNILTKDMDELSK